MMQRAVEGLLHLCEESRIYWVSRLAEMCCDVLRFVQQYTHNTHIIYKILK